MSRNDRKRQSDFIRNKNYNHERNNMETRETATETQETTSGEKNIASNTNRDNDFNKIRGDISYLRGDISYLKSAVTSFTNSSSKFAKQEDVKKLADGILEFRENIRQGLAKQDDLRNLEGRVKEVSSTAQSVKRAADDIDRKLNVLAKRDEINTSEMRIENKINFAAQDTKTILQRDLKELRSAIFDDAGKSVARIAKDISKSQRNSQEKISQSFTSLEMQLKGIAENAEMIQSLPSKIDDISQILADKGLQLRQDFPTVNHDEETLAELAECGEKILQQLAIAARWYARKLPELNAHETTIQNLVAANEQAVKQARKEGEDFGRKVVIKELLRKYADLQNLMNPTKDSTFEQLKILADFLSNAGVEPIYQLNEEIEITDGNRMNYEHNIENLQVGKIVITSPGYAFDTETIEKATYIPAEEFYAKQEPIESVEGVSAVEESTEVTKQISNSSSAPESKFNEPKIENGMVTIEIPATEPNDISTAQENEKSISTSESLAKG